MNTYEDLGRWLCWQFYRDAKELYDLFPCTFDIFEEAAWKDSAWAELLSGAFRNNQRKLGLTKRASGAKWSRLGEVVRPNLASIDGVGQVRAKELFLYLEVAERFVEAFTCTLRWS